MLGGEQTALKRAFWLDLLWPPSCRGCGQTNSWWCPKCQNELIANWHWRQFHAGLTTLKAVLFCADYHQPLVNQLLKQTKYGRLTTSGKILASSWANFVSQTLSQQLWFTKSVLTAVPLSRNRHNWRGFNQADLLLAAIANHCGNQVLNCWHRQDRPQQARLTRTERLINLNNAFDWRGPLSGVDIVIIDDVLTTGTTLEQAANCLYRAGAREVRGLVLAH